jgi:hypothetical protein
MRKVIKSFAAVVLFTLAAGAVADDVEMRTGRVFSGKILKEDDTSVTIEWRGGEMTIPRQQIKDIRRTPPAEQTAAAGKAVAKKTPETAPPPKDPPKPQKPVKTFAERLAEIEAIRLAPWPEEPAVPCTETGAKAYKIVKSDGTTSMKDDRPSSTSGVESIWLRDDADFGRTIEFKDGARQFFWYRLYWNDDAKEWRVLPAALEAFQADSSRAAALVTDLCKDQGATAAAAADAKAIRYGTQSNAAYDPAADRAKLLEDCRKAMGSDAGGDALVAWHDCESKMESAKTPAEKVTVAADRRAVLRRLVAATLVK